MTPSAWHARYVQQAHWTRELRRYIYERINLPDVRHILDVGCGTGALEEEMRGLSEAEIIGLDIQPASLQFAQSYLSGVSLVVGDAHFLPFASEKFEVVLCHFLLMWLDDTLRAIKEMYRVTRPGGAVIALAEPDYGGRVDYPPELENLGKMQTVGLANQGANPRIGRQLRRLFDQAGLQGLETGVLGGRWTGLPSPEDWNSEWEMLERDLTGIIPIADLHRLRQVDFVAWQRGERVLYVPTFYAMGRKPERGA